MNKYNFTHLERISKKAAEKAYNAGQKIMFIPCKCNPENTFYNMGAWVEKQEDRDFSKVYNEYCFYNCGYNETGRYPAFYIEK